MICFRAGRVARHRCLMAPVVAVAAVATAAILLVGCGSSSASTQPTSSRTPAMCYGEENGVITVGVASTTAQNCMDFLADGDLPDNPVTSPGAFTTQWGYKGPWSGSESIACTINNFADGNQGDQPYTIVAITNAAPDGSCDGLLQYGWQAGK
jgi:hypothetical protein